MNMIAEVANTLLCLFYSNHTDNTVIQAEIPIYSCI